ncbi:hypothetical protein HY633_04760 [Candidatus Uhrbacteria bacterium]|nr:hypothetical protein [Candidatus Uhrbacteria bacterium]
MIGSKKDSDFLTEDEYRLTVLVGRSLSCEWKAHDDGGRKLVFVDAYALNHFYDMVCRLGEPDGHRLGAAVFLCAADKRKIERSVLSKVLTRLARVLFDVRGAAGNPTEAAVAHFARFIREIVGEVPRMILEWVEDMDTDDAERDLARQPTEVIRGVLFSPSMDHRRAVRFWALAAESPLFPCRIFSDQCQPAEGEMFSAYQRRAFGTFFALAPEAAFQRFAGHVFEATKAPTVLRLVLAGTANWIPAPKPVEQPEFGRRVREDIIGSVKNAERQEALRRIFFPEVKEKPPVEAAEASDPSHARAVVC